MLSPLRNMMISPGRGGASWASYWSQRSLFFLDGSIIDVGGTKYFKDKSTNARNFLITGYDFDSTWTKGFPYKSSATISAPAADAALIAADTNNFWYAGDGTPNQIPVVSLFQNIDYGNTIFCKHEAQVLDANNVEVYEPRVLQIFMASAALSTADLAKAYTYFGAAAYTSGICVSGKGNDSTGDGTLAKPYLTLTKALTAVGTDVVMMTGSNDMGGAQTILSKNVKGVGFVTFSNYGSSYGFNGSGRTLSGLIFNSGGVAQYALYLSTTIDVQRCKGTGSTRYFVYANSGTTMLIKNCVVGVSGSTYKSLTCKASAPTIDGNIFVDTNTGSIDINNAACVAVVKYNKFRGTVSRAVHMTTHYTSVTILNNDTLNCSLVGDATNMNGDITATYNRHSSTGASYFIQNTGGTGTIVVRNNIVSAADVIAVKVTEKNLTAENNIINVNGANAATIVISSATNSITGSISNNRLKNDADGSMVIIGTEGSAMLNKVTATVNKNYMEGPATSNAIHGVFVWGHGAVEIKHNYFKNLGLPVVLKGNNFDHTNSKVFANILDGGRIVIKGVANSNIIGNTVVVKVGEDSPCFYTLPNGTYNSTGTIVKNNIFKNPNATSALSYSVVYSGDADDTFTSDNNLIYSGGIPIGNNGTSEFATMALWRAAGFDVHSQNADPLLTNFIPAANSPAIGNGESQDAAYDDGMDAITNWGDTSTVPSVTTKQQGATWDIGAYIH